jgi:integrase
MQPKLRDARLFWRGKTIWAHVLGPAGRKVRKSTKCTDEAAAVARANELERVAADPRYAAAAATSFAGAVEALRLDMVRRKRSAATLSKAKGKLGHFARIWGGDLPMLRITAKLVMEYIDKRQSETASDHTIYMELGHLRMVLKIAIHLGTFHGSVAQVMPPYFGSGHKPRDRFATPDELTALLKQFDRRRGAHILYIVATGARYQESFRARRRDTNKARGIVHLHGTKTAFADDDIPITRVNAPILDEALKHAPGADVLFHPWGKMVRDMAAACVRAGIPRLGPNDLRRTFAKWHLLAGVNINAVSKMLRHSTDKLAQTTYAKATGEEMGALVEAQLEAHAPRPVAALPECVDSVPTEAQTTAEASNNQGQNEPKAAVKDAPPGRFELPTFALGKRSENTRSVGNKKAYQRKREASVVPVLYGDVRSETPRIPGVASAVVAYWASEFAPTLATGAAS